jgi:hypothetical protein
VVEVVAELMGCESDARAILFRKSKAIEHRRTTLVSPRSQAPVDVVVVNSFDHAGERRRRHSSELVAEYNEQCAAVRESSSRVEDRKVPRQQGEHRTF